MGKTARFVLKTVAAGLALCALICLIVGSWSDLQETLCTCRERRRLRKERFDYDDEDLYS